MIAIHQDKVKAVISKFPTEIKDQRSKAITALERLIPSKNGNDLVYLNEIISLFKNNTDIIIWEPERLVTEISLVPTVPLIQKNYKKGPKMVKSVIKEDILKALNYKNLRSSFYPKYFKEIGIKACVYCNSQLTVIAKKPKNGYSAKFDVDHYHSKDDYPFLSICLFNLYPACSSCNRAKSKNKIEFGLYTNDTSKTKKSEYSFKLDSNTTAKYLTTKDSTEINFSFDEPTYPIGIKSFNESFHIEGIYQTQDDLIEELIIKSQMYNNSYVKILKSNFNKLSINPELFKRTLVGNYTNEKDIHKRPMSKFVMDIAKQLGLID